MPSDQSKRGPNCLYVTKITDTARRRSQRPFRPPKGVGYFKHFEHMGLVYLAPWTAPLPAHASGDSTGESRMREICMSGSTRGG